MTSAKDLPKCLQPAQVHEVAEFKKNCDKCQLDLSDAQTTLGYLQMKQSDNENSTFFWGGVLTGTATVIIACSLFGKCWR